MNSEARIQKSELPFVFINMAMTADGKIATANRAVHSFGSARDLAHLYELRASADAILCGARTVEISEATLGNGGEKYRKLRLKSGLAEFPIRVIVTGSGTMDPGVKIFQKHFSPLIILTTQKAPAPKLATLRKLADQVKIFGQTEVDFPAALAWLRKNYGVKRLLCEGGGELNDALFRADLVDEVHLTICPKVFGGNEAPTLSDGRGFAKLELTRRFEFSAICQKKGELFTVLFRSKQD
jgi:riboflavin-specific deaminase-like protein